MRRALDAAADHLTRYPFKRWGFGEDIGLRGLHAYGLASHRPELVEYVWDTVADWCHGDPELRYEHHVAPGMALLDAHTWRPDDRLWGVALRLAELFASFPVIDGIPVHRPDLEAWDRTIWVDCMALDAPFLVRLGRASGDDRWTDLGVAHIESYARALAQADSGLFRHGYDTFHGTQSCCAWGRGNGWAMHGLVDTLAELPRTHHARDGLRRHFRALLTSVIETQDPSGLWHTILDDPEAPLEASTAPLFASAVRKADAIQIVPPELHASSIACVEAAELAIARHLADDGGYPVSSATPIGERPTYVGQPHGNFPWGHGPLLLWASYAATTHPSEVTR